MRIFKPVNKKRIPYLECVYLMLTKLNTAI